MQQYETVIGLEVHVELATKTKIFCGCSTEFGGSPNSHTCPVCLGMPGSLPVLNKKVVEYAIAIGLACGCDITEATVFDRKNYFYPDNPQNYQISQLYAPICRNGKVRIVTEQGEKTIRIHEMHMEEDAGKLIHDAETGETMIDYNRSGVPLMEIVTEPDFLNAEEVVAFLEKLRLMIQYLGASDCKIQEGSMRVDVNLSVKEKGSEKLGTRTEMKNLSSFRSVSRAIEQEAKRQIMVLSEGGTILQETRRYDEDKNITVGMRLKETVRDYRYFPEPDLKPLLISKEWIEQLRAKQPELREEKKQRYIKEFRLSEYDADILTSSKQMADFFEGTVELLSEPKEIANWLMTEAMRLLKETGKDFKDICLTEEGLAELVRLVLEKKINRTIAKEVFELMFSREISPLAYVTEKGLLLVEDEGKLNAVIDKVLVECLQSVIDYKNGKERAFGFFVGQTMKAMEGKASPDKVRELLKERMSKDE